jgi:hypothetical protein
VVQLVKGADMARQRSRARTPDDRQREAFFAEIGHTEGSHQRPGDRAEEFGPVLGLRARRFAAGNSAGVAAHLVEHCGWWWCAERDSSLVRWSDLRVALAVLRDHGVDPWGADVVAVVGQAIRVKGWAEEREGYQALATTLSTPLGRDAETLRQKWLAELAPLRRNALACEPAPAGRGRPPQHAQAAALSEAQARGWGADVVAAIFLLTGYAKEALEALRNRLRQYEHRQRTRLALVP